MLEFLREQLALMWVDVMRTHVELVEKRTTEAADAHKEALLDWWHLSEVYDREVMTRLAASQQFSAAYEAYTTSTADVP